MARAISESALEKRPRTAGQWHRQPPFPGGNLKCVNPSEHLPNFSEPGKASVSLIPSHETDERQGSTDGLSGECVQLFKSLIDLHPAKALRLLRETRPRRIRRDLDEVDTTRRELLADCFPALNRPALAAAMRK